MKKLFLLLFNLTFFICSIYSDVDILSAYTEKNAPFFKIINGDESWDKRIYSYETVTSWKENEDSPGSGILYFREYPINIIMQVQDNDGFTWGDIDSTDYDLSAILKTYNSSNILTSSYVLYDDFDIISGAIKVEDTNLKKPETFDSGITYGYVSIGLNAFSMRQYSEHHVQVDLSGYVDYIEINNVETTFNNSPDQIELEVWMSKNDRNENCTYISFVQDNIGPENPVLNIDKYRDENNVFYHYDEENEIDILYTKETSAPLYFVPPVDKNNEGSKGSGYYKSIIRNANDHEELVYMHHMPLFNMIAPDWIDDVTISSGKTYELIHYDNVHNRSETLEFSIIQDIDAPVIEFEMNEVFYEPDGFSYLIDLNNSLRITDEGCGVESSEYFLYQKDSDGNFVRKNVNPFTSKRIMNLTPGEIYKIGIKATDNLNNTNSSQYLTNEFSLPPLPFLDYEDQRTGFTWDESKSHLTLKLIYTIPQVPSETIIFNTAIPGLNDIMINPTEWIHRNNGLIYEIEISKTFQNFKIPDLLHKKLNFFTNITMNGLDFTQTISLPAIENRPPTVSMMHALPKLIDFNGSFSGELIPKADFAGYSNSPEFNASPEYYYKKFNPDDSENDFSWDPVDMDNDSIELKKYNNQLLYLEESYIIDGIETKEYYILPYRFKLDNIGPTWIPENPIALIMQGEEEIPIFETVTYVKDIPLGFNIACEDNATGISSIIIEPIGETNKNLPKGSYPVEVDDEGNLYIPWPYEGFNPQEGNTFHGKFNLIAVDGVGNVSTPQTFEFYIDKEIPEIPNQDQGGWIYTDRGDIKISIDDGNVRLDWQDYLEGKEPHELSEIELIQSGLTINEENKDYVIFSLPETELGNNTMTVSFNLKDITGNIRENVTLSYATPAFFSSEDLEIYGSDEFKKEYSDFHEYDFYRNSEKAIEWESLEILMLPDGERIMWDGLEELHFLHSPHAETSFEIVPVNASGIKNLDAIVTLDVTAQNYAPLISTETGLLHQREDQFYLHPASSFDVLVKDYDDDACTTEVKINDVLTTSRESDGLSILQYDGDFAFSLNSCNLDFVNDEIYKVDFITSDGTDETVSSLSFVYDSEAPSITSYSPMLEDLEEPWGFHKLDLISSDNAGAGLSKVVLEYEGLDKDTTIFTADEGTFLDNIQLSHQLPEGEYNLNIYLEDALGQGQSTVAETLPIRNDITPPQILDTELTAASEIPVSDGVSLYSSNNVRTQIEWDDNLSSISMVEFRYLNDGDMIFEDSKLVSTMQNRNNVNSDVINCAIPRDYIVEEEVYQIELQLTDEGGNTSGWYDCGFRLSFDFSSPVIDEVTWDLLRKEGKYICTSNSVDFPDISVRDNMGLVENDEIEITYSLLDHNATFLTDCNGNIEFTESGSYILRILVKDRALQTATRNVNLVYDNQGPHNLSINWINGSPTSTVPSQTVQLQLQAEDDLVSVDYFELELSDDQGVYWHTELPYSHNYYSVSLPDTQDCTSDSLNFTLYAVDIAGNRSEEFLQRISRIYPDKYMTFSGKPYIGLDNILSLQWNYAPDEVISHYNLTLMGIKENESSHILWEGFREAAALSMDLSSLDIPMSDYKAAILIVRPVDKGGLALEVYSSDRVFTDFTKPAVSIESDKTCIQEDIEISWLIEEESPIIEGTFIIEEIVKNDENNTLSFNLKDSAHFSNIAKEDHLNLRPYFDLLDLENLDSVRLGLRVCDIAGNFSTVYTPAIRVDHSPSPDFGVFDQGDYINPNENDLVFNWFWAETDPEAGKIGYYYQLNSIGVPNEGPWLFTTEREISFSDFPEDSYPNGTELFLFVKRQNETGMEPIQSSNGIIIDRTKPVITQVSVTTTIGAQEDVLQFSKKEEVFININGYDPDSGINRYAYRSGALDSGAYNSTREYKQSSVDLFEGTLPIDYPAGTILSFEAICYNGAEEESLPSYSPGILFAPADPLLEDVISSPVGDSIYVSWTAASMIPIVSQRATLYSVNGQKFYETEPLYAGLRCTTLDQPAADGAYLVEVQFTDYTGAVTKAQSNIFYIDSTAPEVIESNISSFIYRDISSTFKTNESIQEYRIDINCMGNNLSSGNIQTEVPTKYITFNKDLDDSIFWTLLNSNESLQFQLTLYVKDLAGNWSEPNNYILKYDGTKPELLSFDFEELYWNEELVAEPYLAHLKDRIENAKLYAEDLESGIVAYRWALVESSGDIPAQWNLWHYLSEPNISFQDSNMVLDLPGMQQHQRYAIALQVQNEAGLVSDTFWSEEFKVDLSSPEFDLEINGNDIISTSPAEGIITITEETLPYFEMKYTIYQPNGTALFNESRSINMAEANDSIISFPIDNRISGNWKIEMSLQDIFGRTSFIARDLPINSGPQFDIPENITCFPGEKFSLDISQWVIDSQGIATVQIEEITPDALAPLSALYLWDELAPIDFTLEHSSEMAQETEYIYTLKAVDSLGAESETQFSIKVINSQRGLLAGDEYWSGEHYITGAIIVPSGVTLTLAPDTRVLARAGGLYGEDQEILIEPGASLILEGAAYFGTDGVEESALWKGITFMESHNIDSVTIEKARIGLLIAEGISMDITNSSFIDNEIGLHLFSDTISVSNSEFYQNRFYGVKEEKDTNPLMSRNRFRDNGFDYYDFEKTVIDATDLNSLSENNELNEKEGE